MKDPMSRIGREIERYKKYYTRLRARRVFGIKKNWYKHQLILATEGMINSFENMKHGTPLDDSADLMEIAKVFGKTLDNYLVKNE